MNAFDGARTQGEIVLSSLKIRRSVIEKRLKLGGHHRHRQKKSRAFAKGLSHRPAHPQREFGDHPDRDPRSVADEVAPEKSRPEHQPPEQRGAQRIQRERVNNPGPITKITAQP